MENKPLKIVYCTPALYMAGGVERVLTLKANYFAEHFGYDITIILTEGKDKPLFYPLSDKIKVINLDINFEVLWTCSFIKKIFVYLKKQRQYKKLLTEELMKIRPDITISLLRREINFINEIKDGSKKIGELHVNRANYRSFDENESNCIKQLFSKWWMKDLVRHLKKLNAFVVLTDEDRKAWAELEKVFVIPNPLPFYPLDEKVPKEKRFIAVGRYSPEKGYDFLLHAWSKVQSEDKEWRLDIFGEGDRSLYEKMLYGLHIDRQRCSLHGRTNHIQYEYVKSSCAVCTSRYEGFGMAILEAKACGLPVVSFDCPWGPRAILSDGEDGILVTSGDVGELVRAMLIIMKNDRLRENMAHNSKRNSSQFRIECISYMWKSLFEEVSS